MDQAARRRDGQRHHLVLDHAAPAVPEPEQLVAVLALRAPHERADHRVQARAVAAAGQHPDAHCTFLPIPPRHHVASR
jgi:hypothetical protein